MTDDQLIDYLGLRNEPRARDLIRKLPPGKRDAYERLHQIEIELNLWQAGVGPKPTGVIVCQPHKRN